MYPPRSTYVRTALAVFALFAARAPVSAQPFVINNLAVERIGDGAATLTNAATPGFIHQYLPAVPNQTTPVSTIALPTTPSGSDLALTHPGTATSNGFLTRTVNGTSLVVPGYNAPVGTATVATTPPGTINRTIGIVNPAGAINTSNGYSDGPSADIRSVASVDGSGFWLSTTGTATTPGVLFKTNTGTVTTTTPILNGNTRALNIFNNSLFVSSASATPGVGISLIGTSGTLPTAAATATLLPGTGTSGTGTPSPYGFVLVDNPLNAANWNGTGFDTMYIADDRTNGSGGIQRWEFNPVTSMWGLTVTVANSPTTGARGLAATISGNVVTMFATTTEASANFLITFSETLTPTGGAIGPVTTLAQAPANTVFRGVALAPIPEPAHILLLGGVGLGLFRWRRAKV